jgi:hypothetical protein
MKYFKMLGLAAITAMAAMAFVGASSASADDLCKVNESPCSETNKYPIGTVLKGSSKEAVLTSGEFKVTCESAVEGKTTEDLGAGKGLLGLIEKLTFSSCKGSCTSATAIHTPYMVTAFASSQTANVFSDGSGKPGASLGGCLGFATCVFETEAAEAVLKVIGGNPAHMKAEAVKLKESSGVCPTSGTWTADYTMSPAPMFLVND